MTGERTIKEIVIEKNRRGDVLKIRLEEYRGHRLCSLRVWFQERATGRIRPTREGFGLNVRLLSNLIAKLIKIEAEARRIGWLPRAGSEGEARCAECGEFLSSGRADAKFCSATCRKRASRGRVTDRTAAITRAGGSRDALTATPSGSDLDPFR